MKILWRLIQFPIVLAVIYLATFLLVWVAPGSPFEGERKLNPVVENELKTQYHADTAWHFLEYYPLQMLKGDFGPSMSYQGWSVGQVMKQSLPISITLGIFALTIATIAGCTLGTLAAVRRGGAIELLGVIVTLTGVSLPGFVAAGVLVAIFSDRLHWFPGGGWGGIRHLILPASALSLLPLAYIAQLTRVSMLEVMNEDYVRTARAKGLSPISVIWHHAFRNAILPVFTYLGPAAAAAMTGSFVIEYIFNIPGLGQHFVAGVKNRDQTLILGTVMVYSCFLLGLNLLVDLGYTLVDPRIDISQ
jgi:ABC-type dipeptide/oligopeptide/nickel transport system permease component